MACEEEKAAKRSTKSNSSGSKKQGPEDKSESGKCMEDKAKTQKASSNGGSKPPEGKKHRELAKLPDMTQQQKSKMTDATLASSKTNNTETVATATATSSQRITKG